MVHTKDLVKASLNVPKAFLQMPKPAMAGVAGVAGAQAAQAGHSLVPIRSLGTNHRPRIAAHLLALDSHDRYFRFGYAASDEQIQRYVEGLNFERDEIFGIYNRRLELLAMAHLAYPADKTPGRQLAPGFADSPANDPAQALALAQAQHSMDSASSVPFADDGPGECWGSCAEFGVSVSKGARGRGYGARLFERAAMHARNDRVSLMFIHALSENTVMLQIARKAGATLHQLGSESEAYLRLDAPTFDSRMTEILQEQIAQADYRLKFQAKLFWAFLTQLQDMRRGVTDAMVGLPRDGSHVPW